MNREEAIDILFGCIEAHSEEENEALDIAIEALSSDAISKAYNQGFVEGSVNATVNSNYICPRCGEKMEQYKSTKAEPSEDGTLEVKVEDATKVGRVLISDDKHRGGLYYPDEDEPQGDLISRAEAIEAIEIVDWYHQNSNKDMVHGANSDEHQAWYKAADVYRALEAVPPADRPKGEWIHTPNGIDRDFVWWTCSECGHKIFSETEKDRIEFHAYCGRCGAYMRGDMK